MASIEDELLNELMNGTPAIPAEGGSRNIEAELMEEFLGAQQPSAVSPGQSEIPQEMVFDPRTGGYVDTALAARRMGPAQGAGATYLAGTPFIGEYVDEAMGAVDSVMTGRNPEIATQTMRESRQQFSEDYPKTAVAAGVAGSVVGSLPAAAALGPGMAAHAPASVAGRTAVAIPTGAAVGAGEGYVSGYGRGVTPEDRQEKALSDAQIGAIFGGAIGLAGPLTHAGVSNLISYVTASDVKQISKRLGISRDAAKVIKRYIENDDIAAAARTLALIGDDAMLADAGPSTRQALDTAMSEGGPALRVGRDAVEGRAADTAPRLRATFDTILGKPQGTKTAVREVAGRTVEIRQKAYDAAYARPIDYSSPNGYAIEGVIDRIPQRTLREAVDRANDSMQAAGRHNKQIMLDMDTGEFSEMPNVQQLDYLVRALQDKARKSIGNDGLMDDAGMEAMRLARELRTSLGDAVPIYKRAVKLGGDNRAAKDAVMLGRNVLSDRVNLEDVVDEMRGASAEQRKAFKQGLREAIEKQMAKVKAVASDPNVEAREARAAILGLTSRDIRNKIRAAIGDPAADRLFKELDKELPQLETRAGVARNSATAIRTAGSKQISDITAPGPLGKLARGQPVETAREVIKALTNTTAYADDARRAELLREVADVLVNTRGKNAKDALMVVERALSGQTVTNAEASQIARIVSTSLMMGGYQSGTQALAQ